MLRGFADGDRFRQRFVIVTLGGEPLLSTHAELTRMIGLVVQPPAALHWEPRDAKVGREPLDDAGELKALTDFCTERGIAFVAIAAG